MATSVTDLLDALNHLYDYQYLRYHPIRALLPQKALDDSGRSVQQMLVTTIEQLKPQASVPADSPPWRLYYVLFYRFVQGLTVAAVAARLNLSERHLKREQSRAIEALADLLKYRQEENLSDDEVDNRRPQTQLDVEITRLQGDSPLEAIGLSHLLYDVLSMLERPLRMRCIVVECQLEPDLPAVLAYPPMLRQALVTAVGLLHHTQSNGTLSIWAARLHEDKVTVHFAWRPQKETTGSSVDGLGAMAASPHVHTLQELLSSFGAELHLVAGDGLLAYTLLLPAADTRPILVIEDNPDTLQLYRRYLTGTGYQLHTAPAGTVQQAVAEVAPVAIILDIMMPEHDGWEILMQLRQQPDTANLPVLVCSVLDSPEIALGLGASAVRQKPISQQDLLSLLEQLTRGGQDRG